ncbi:MAG: integrase, partial [Candidatus Korarchaeum sp.]
MPKWDKGAAFDELKEKILALLREERQKAKRGSVIARKRLAHTIILLIQLRNGSRVGEAIEAFFKFKESKEREVRVRLEKQRGY